LWLIFQNKVTYDRHVGELPEGSGETTVLEDDATGSLSRTLLSSGLLPSFSPALVFSEKVTEMDGDVFAGESLILNQKKRKQNTLW
jgi:hypothetical protein